MQKKRDRTLARWKSRALGLTENTARLGKELALQSLEPLREKYRMASPDGRIFASLWTEKGNLYYEVFLQGAKVLAKAPLGLVTKTAHLGQGVVLGKPSFSAAKETFPVRGAHKTGVDEHHNYEFPVRHLATGFTWTLNMRLWNGGFGFRYTLPENSRALVVRDAAEFALPEAAECFYQTDLVKMQGKTHRVPVHSLEKGLSICCMPLFSFAEGYCLLTETELDNFAGAALKHLGGGRFGLDFWDSDPFFVTGCVSPWRIAILAETPDELVNSDVIRASARPPRPELAEASWIRPGKATWSFFVNKPVAREEATIRAFVKDSAKLGFPYTIIDEGWRKWARTEEECFAKVADIVKEAKSLGVDVWLWQASSDRLYSPKYRRYFLRRCREIGVVGVKIDFLESESQATINFYREFLEDAAKEKLMVIYHNPNKPTGLSRTYPHLLSREAVRGMQTSCDPEDNVILPFTRFVGGDADYTPFCFSVPERKGSATLGHMLANTVVFQSSLLTISEHPANLVDHIAVDFLRLLPVCYDETRVLPGTVVGEKVIFARKSGDDWFFALQQGPDQKGNQTVFPDFLDPDAAYDLTLFSDVPGEPDKLQREEKTVRRGDRIAFFVPENGGAAGVFRKKG